MRYLKSYKLFENGTDPLSEIGYSLGDALQDLVDDEWVVNTNYNPKRWENPKSNHFIKRDFINITIKKNRNKALSKYPPGSEFKLKDIKETTLRILNMFPEHEVDLSYCVAEGDTHDGTSDLLYKFGVWRDPVEGDNTQEPVRTLLASDIEVLGVSLNVYLDGNNLDNFKHPYYWK